MRITLNNKVFPKFIQATEPDAELYFNRMAATGVAVSSSVKAATGVFIRTLKEQNIWGKCITIAPLYGGVGGLLVPLKSPTSSNYTIESGAVSPTYVNNVARFAANSGVDLGLNLADYDPNNLAIFTKIVSSTLSGIVVVAGNPTFTLEVRPLDGAGMFSAAVGSSSYLAYAPSGYTGLWGVVRDGNVTRLYKNGLQVDSESLANVPLSGGLVLGKRAGSAIAHADYDMSFALVTNTLSSSEIIALNLAVSDYEAALGR